MLNPWSQCVWVSWTCIKKEWNYKDLISNFALTSLYWITIKRSWVYVFLPFVTLECCLEPAWKLMLGVCLCMWQSIYLQSLKNLKILTCPVYRGNGKRKIMVQILKFILVQLEDPFQGSALTFEIICIVRQSEWKSACLDWKFTCPKFKQCFIEKKKATTTYKVLWHTAKNNDFLKK